MKRWTKVTMKIRECQCGICLGPRNLERRMTTSGCSCTRWETRAREDSGTKDDGKFRIWGSVQQTFVCRARREPVLEDTRGHSRTHEIRRAMQREENRRNNGGWSKQVWMKFYGKSRPWDIGVEERGRELRERWGKEEWNGG